MACYHLMQLRAQEALDIEHPQSDFEKIFANRNHKPKMSYNPFADKKRGNPFGGGGNPFK